MSLRRPLPALGADGEPALGPYPERGAPLAAVVTCDGGRSRVLRFRALRAGRGNGGDDHSGGVARARSHHRASAIDCAAARGRRCTRLGPGGSRGLRQDDARPSVVRAAGRPGRVVSHDARLGGRGAAGGAARRPARLARAGAATRAGEGRNHRIGQSEPATARPRDPADVRDAAAGHPPRRRRVGGGGNGRGRGAPVDAGRGSRHPVPDHDENATRLVHAAPRGLRRGSRDRRGRARDDGRRGGESACRCRGGCRPSAPDAHRRRLARRPRARRDERRRRLHVEPSDVTDALRLPRERAARRGEAGDAGTR